MIENDGTNMAAELSGDPKGPRFNAKSAFAYRGLVFVIPIRSWEYAVLIASTGWHYHLCTSLHQIKKFQVKLHYSSVGGIIRHSFVLIDVRKFQTLNEICVNPSFPIAYTQN